MKETKTEFSKSDHQWMLLALKMAKKAEKNGEVPIGAVLVGPDNKLISAAYNIKESHTTPIGHAEILAIHRSARKLKNWRLIDCTLYVTLEPCAMCAGALIQARIKRLVFGTRDPKAGACKSLFEITTNPKLNHRVEVYEGLLAKDCGEILTNFFRTKRK